MDNQPTIYVSPQHKQNKQTQDTSDEVWISAPAKRKRPFLVLFFWLLGLSTVAFIGLATLAILFYSSSWILPGTTVLGQNIGGMTRAEAASTLQASWQQRIIYLNNEQVQRQVNPDTLGMTLDVSTTIAQAHAQGRTLNSLERMITSGGSLVVQPIWSFEPAVAEAYFASLANEVDIEPVNAGVVFQNGSFIITPPADGMRLDQAAAMATLQQNPALALQNGRLSLTTQPVAPAIADTTLITAKVQELRTTAIPIRTHDPINDTTTNISIQPDVWGQWLTLRNESAEGLSWTVAEEQLSSFLQQSFGELNNGRYIKLEEIQTAVRDAMTSPNTSIQARIYHAPKQHTVQAGDTLSSIGYAYGIPYPWIQQANPTASAGLSVGQALTIPSPDDLIPFPVIDHKRIVVSISQQKVWAYENGTLKWEWVGSTGIANSPTSPGIFQIQTHEIEAYAGNWDLHMPYFMGIYQPAPTVDFMNGFHGFPTRDGHNLLWTGNLGHPVTYGCILISTDNAEQLFSWAEQGVIVEIQR